MRYITSLKLVNKAISRSVLIATLLGLGLLACAAALYFALKAIER